MLGRHGEALKVAVTVPPEGGKANRAVLALIAEHFDLAKRDVELVSGHSSRRKRLLLRGVKVEDLKVPD